jgi:hypothetical protein
VFSSVITGSNTTGIVIPAGVQAAANPTSQLFNGTTDFTVPTGSGPQPASFIFAGEGGTIAGWAGGNPAVTAFDDGVVNGANHAVYKVLAVGSVASVNYLYAIDLHNNKIDVFDTNFAMPPPGRACSSIRRCRQGSARSPGMG